MTEEFKHPTIGSIRGLAKDGLLQFLGVKYALLQDRFAEPELVSEYNSSTIDATKVGPQALSDPLSCEAEYSVFQQSLPHQPFDISDRDCLHLTITIPREAKDLPVFIFIHGGSFTIGSNAWPQYDQTRLVRQGVEMGMPFIGVGVNYRVGVPGFLTSAELRRAGYKPNNGIRDQRAALMWVQRFISGFGGDPNKVTLAGQSAGAVSAMLHLAPSASLFSQLVLMSGSSFVISPLPLPVAEGVYNIAVNALRMDGLSAEGRLKALVEGDGKPLYKEIPSGLPLLPVVDDEVVLEAPDYTTLDLSATICPRLLIGDCRLDGHILLNKDARVRQRFHESLVKTLGPVSAREVEETYGVTPDMPSEIVAKHIAEFMTDVGFFTPAVTIAKAWPVPSFLYHFNEPNTWDGPWKGEATHCLEIVYLFQNLNHKLTEEQQSIAKGWAGAVIKFIRGAEPFPSCGSEPDGMVFGPVEDIPRKIHKLNDRFGLDTLNRAMQMFMQSK